MSFLLTLVKAKGAFLLARVEITWTSCSCLAFRVSMRSPALFFAAPAVVATPKMKAAKSNKSFFISFYYI